jgi:hypothetical protein
MKTIALIALAFPVLAMAGGIVEPTFSANEALKISNTYIETEKKIELEKYNVQGVSFDYFETTSKEARWFITYVAKPNSKGGIAIGDHFSVLIKNTKKPEIELIPGL